MLRRPLKRATPWSALLVAALLSATADAQRGRGPGLTVLAGGTVHVGNGDVLSPGTVVLRGDKVVAVGADVPTPPGAKVVDASGRHVYPGLIDANSRLLMDAGSYRGAGNPDGNALDGLDLFQPYAVEEALAQGVTGIYVAPGMGLVDGSGAVLRLLPGNDPAALALKDGHTLSVGYGDPNASAASILRQYQQLSGQLQQAKKYAEAWEDYEEKLEEYKKELEKLRKEEGGDEKADAAKKAPEKKDETGSKDGAEDKSEEQGTPGAEGRPGGRRRPGPDGGGAAAGEDRVDAAEWLARAMVDDPPRPPRGRGGPQGRPTPAGNNGGDAGKNEKKDEGPKKPKAPARNPVFDALRDLLAGKRTMVATVHQAADILNLLDLQQEYHFRLILSGASEAHKVADAVRRAKVPVILGLGAGQDGEAARVLAEKGVPFAIATPTGAAGQTRYLALSGAAAVAAGLDAEAALEALTAEPARILGVADRVGTLAAGKDANVVVASGPPLQTTSQVEQVYVAGQLVYQR